MSAARWHGSVGVVSMAKWPIVSGLGPRGILSVLETCWQRCEFSNRRGLLCRGIHINIGASLGGRGMGGLRSFVPDDLASARRNEVCGDAYWIILVVDIAH